MRTAAAIAAPGAEGEPEGQEAGAGEAQRAPVVDLDGRELEHDRQADERDERNRRLVRSIPGGRHASGRGLQSRQKRRTRSGDSDLARPAGILAARVSLSRSARARATPERVISAAEPSGFRGGPGVESLDARFASHRPARRARRGRQEHDRGRVRRRRSSSSTPGSRSRATSTSGSTSCCRTSRICGSDATTIRAVVLTHGARGPRRGAAVLPARGGGARGLGDPADARARQVEARRARPPALDRAQGGRPRGPARRAGPVQAGVRAHGALRSRLGRDRPRDLGRPASSTRATTRSTTRRWTGCRPTSADSPRSATAASTCCSATRRTPSGRA